MSQPPNHPGRDVSIGAIIAGGQASRLGGGDKGLRRVGGRTILARVIDVLQTGCETLVLNANGDPARFAGLGLPVVADSLAAHPGPLAGILAVLDWAADAYPHAAYVATAPADTPFLPADLVARLEAQRRESGAAIVCARSGGIRHPVAALWPVALRGDLRRALVDEGMRKAGLYLARHAVAEVDWPSEPVDPFFNVNTADDLAAAEAIAARL